MADPSSSSLPSLTVLGGDKAGAQFVFEEAVDNVLIGADPSCRFCLDLPGVSPVHARIWIDDTGITIYDTNSPRGLFVNDDRVEGQVRLRNGDIIWLGSPGDEQSVMIQCRIASREPRAETAAPSAEAPEEAPAVAPQTEAQAADFATGFALADEAATAAETVALPPAVAPPASLRLTPIPPTTAKPAQEFEEDLGEAQEASVPAQATTTPVPAAARPQPPTITPRPATVTPAPASAAVPQRPEARASGAQAPPRTARPGAPRPAAAGRVAGRPASKARSAGGGVGRVIAALVVVLFLLGITAAAAWYFLVRPRGTRVATATPTPVVATPTSVPTAAPPMASSEVSPAPTPEATPEPVEVVIPVKPTPTPKVTPSPAKPTPSPTRTPVRATPTAAAAATSADAGRAAQQAARVAGLLAQGDQAVAARNFDAAVAFYDEVLGLEPGNSSASMGRTAAAAAAFCWKRSFVPGRTVVQAGKGGRADLQGFESSDVKVAKAPEYSGLIDFQASPARVLPGDTYSIRASLTNDGRKVYRLANVTVSQVVNGNRSPVPATLPGGEIQPKQGIALVQTGGAWPEGVRSWTLEIVATTTRGDTFSSQVVWR